MDGENVSLVAQIVARDMQVYFNLKRFQAELTICGRPKRDSSFVGNFEIAREWSTGQRTDISRSIH